ncbi:UDP-N-acetylmuramoyl-L-alanyl-D-glutamate--2,6-diaminopimelate ligase [Cardiobacteriaceae bacterium TAE3-ERU3]|nr:UDP-N-acetylmuramoyl-L-alanyl-D-glutamate--2,6-diaminopimelate ligase [Cardiobacteriaceae bacterium TAE3-ERU3]
MPDVAVRNIETDSRLLNEHTWWLASKGVSSHALDHAGGDLLCAGVVYEPPYASVDPQWIAFSELSQHIGDIAARFYDHPSQKMTVFAVTGTDGKSSLVHFLAQALDAGMIGTIGNGRLENLQKASHTTPDALNMQRLLADFVTQDIKRVAMEVSSHALDQGRIGGVDVDVAVFSNLSRDHLDYHNDMEDYFLAKARLFSRPIKHAVINIDDEYGRRLIDDNLIYPDATIWAVSSHGRLHNRADHLLQAKEITLHSGGIRMMLQVDGEAVAIDSTLLARFNVDNLLNVAACLLTDGLAVSDLAAKLRGLRGVPGRVERIALPQGCAAMVDYAHTPGAVENALQGVRAHVAGKLWVIFGCGGNRDKGKRPLMAAAAERYADCVVVTDDNPRHEDPNVIVQDVLAGLEYPQKVQVIQPRDVAIRSVLAQMQAGDGLLIAGKGHEDYQIIGDIRHPFSDQDVVRSWVEEVCN